MDGKLTIRPTTGTVQSLRTSLPITRSSHFCWDSLLTRYGSYDGSDIFLTCVFVHYFDGCVKRVVGEFILLTESKVSFPAESGRSKRGKCFLRAKRFGLATDAKRGATKLRPTHAASERRRGLRLEAGEVVLDGEV